LRTKWLHSELDAFERVGILRELREGAFDVLVGVNLLREGIDLPEVSMVCIMDADKEGFLRSESALIQTIGRAARNVNAEVVLYADRITGAMQRAMDETSRRRALQIEYNKEHGITPQSIVKAIRRGIEDLSQAKTLEREAVKLNESEFITEEYLNQLEQDMLTAAESLDFEKAAALRDRILELKAQKSGGPARPAASPQGQSARSRARSKKQADNRTKPPRPSIS
jgi:excinuclease ABC subunit B